MTSFDFELVSPERLLISQPVGMVIVPGEEGDFGVLPGHAPLIASLRTGILNIYNDGKVSERIFVTGGFAEVTPSRCTVLAEEAVNLKDLDAGKLEAEAQQQRDELAVLSDADVRAKAEKKLADISLKLAAINDRTYN